MYTANSKKNFFYAKRLIKSFKTKSFAYLSIGQI